MSMTRANLADHCLQSSCIITWGLGCIGPNVHSLDDGSGLATGLKLSRVVLNHSFNSRDEVESSGKGRNVKDSGGSADHKMVPVGHYGLGISQSEDISELHLFWILASLTHDLI